tara:strand:+ start:465 stop:839 length:375 start_codon:yes stop_codon:yes gene_type:complete
MPGNQPGEETSGTFQINGDISGSNGINLIGADTLRLNGVNAYIGSTTLGSGNLFLGADDLIADTSTMIFSGGTLLSNGFSDTMGTLTLLDISAIDLGTGDSASSFYGQQCIELDCRHSSRHFEF